MLQTVLGICLYVREHVKKNSVEPIGYGFIPKNEAIKDSKDPNTKSLDDEGEKKTTQRSISD